MQAGSVAIPGTVNLRIGAQNTRRRKTGKKKSMPKKSTYANRAKLRQAYLKGKYPSSQWAHPYVRRGQGHFGLTAGLKYSEVNAAEQAFRKSIGWRGRGEYMSGKGAYLGRAAGGFLGKAAASALGTTAAFSSGGAFAAASPFLHAGLSDLGSRIGDRVENFVIDKYRTFVLLSKY